MLSEIRGRRMETAAHFGIKLDSRVPCHAALCDAMLRLVQETDTQGGIWVDWAGKVLIYSFRGTEVGLRIYVNYRIP